VQPYGLPTPLDTLPRYLPVLHRKQTIPLFMSLMAERLEMRKVVERAKGILQRDLGITERRPISPFNGRAVNAGSRSGRSRRRS